MLLARAALGQTQAPTPSPTPSPTPTPRVALHGSVDVYYGWNFNRPSDHASFVPGAGTTAKRANEFALNLAALDLALDARPVTLRLIAVAGNGAEVVHAGEPGGEGTGRDIVRHVYQASIGYLAPIGGGLQVEAGIYPSHIGFEGFLSQDNWNYTRAWAGEFSPYYQTGVKASTSLSNRWRFQVHVLNGWQIVGENNDAKAIGTQVAYATERFTASFNTFAGPELPDDDEHWRVFGDLVVVLRATARLQLAAQLDLGNQSFPGPDARWEAAAFWTRYSFSDRTALAARAELFHDPDNGISGADQTLWGATLTLEHRPHPRLILKLEGRYDRSTREVFSDRPSSDDRSARKTDHQGLIVLGAVATF